MNKPSPSAGRFFYGESCINSAERKKEERRRRPRAADRHDICSKITIPAGIPKRRDAVERGQQFLLDYACAAQQQTHAHVNI